MRTATHTTMELQKQVIRFNNGNAAERFDATSAIVNAMGPADMLEHNGEQLTRADWLVYAFVYAPDASIAHQLTVQLANQLACA